MEVQKVEDLRGRSLGVRPSATVLDAERAGFIKKNQLSDAPLQEIARFLFCLPNTSTQQHFGYYFDKWPIFVAPFDHSAGAENSSDNLDSVGLANTGRTVTFNVAVGRGVWWAHDVKMYK